MRFHVDGAALAEGAEMALPPGAARHAQVRRVQPGDRVVLFDGARGFDWPSQVVAMGRSEVTVRVGAPVAVDAELAQRVTLALAMPANERMDAVVEKATELGAAVIQPLTSERSVLRLAGERADRKRAHWQAVAVAACEQCGRARLPRVAPVRALGDWLASIGAAAAGERRMLLSLTAGAGPLRDEAQAIASATAVTLLSGPEGGLTPEEQDAAVAAEFAPVTLGPRVLRADTAPIAALAWIGQQALPPSPFGRGSG